MYVSKYNLVLDTPQKEKVVLNPLSGAIDIVDDAVIQIINRTGDSTQSEMDSILKTCLEKGYIFHDKTEETEKLRQTVEKWYEAMKNHTEHFMAYITFACNLKCTYCFQKNTIQDTSLVMSKDIVKSLFEAIDYIHKERGTKETPFLTLFGGEPFLRRKKHVEAVEEILFKCSENGYNINVATNGVELSFYCEMLSQYRIGNLQVTLDGPKKVHDSRRVFPNGKGTFDNIVAGIDDVLAEGIGVVVRVNVDGQTIKHLPALAHFITEKGWLERGVQVTLSPTAYEPEQCNNEPGSRLYKLIFDMYTAHPETKMMSLNFRLPRIFETVLKYGKMPLPWTQFCWSTSGTSYSMDLNGNIFPCCCMNACCSSEEFRYGTFYPALQLNKKVLKAWHSRNVFSLPHCRNCNMALFCGGGCTRTAIHYGRTLEKGTACPLAITKKEVQTVFNYYFPQLKKRIGLKND